MHPLYRLHPQQESKFIIDTMMMMIIMIITVILLLLLLIIIIIITPNGLTHLAHLCWVVGQQVQGPCENRASGLMSSHQHRQQIIPQLVCRNFISRGNKEAQDAGVTLIDVALLKTCL